MSPSQPLETILNEQLHSVTAPSALWDRVWQPRFEKPQIDLRQRFGQAWTQGFAFGLPVLAAAALIFTVAMRDPAHDLLPSLRAAAAPAKPGSAEIVYQVDQLERAQAVRAITRRDLGSRKPDTRLDSACGLCHTL